MSEQQREADNRSWCGLSGPPATPLDAEYFERGGDAGDAVGARRPFGFLVARDATSSTAQKPEGS